MPDGVQDTLRLKPKEVEELLTELNRAQSNDGTSMRQHKRWALQAQRVVMTVPDKYGNRQHLLAVPQNLSVNGMSVIIGGFMHSGTRVAVTLRRIDGRAEAVSGKVVRCTHIRGHVHTLGIRFERSVAPRDYFIEQSNAYVFNAEHVDVSALSGRVLIFTADTAEQRLLATYFEGSKLDLLYATDRDSAMGALEDEPDLVFADHEQAEGDGIEFVLAMRTEGYTMPVVLMTVSRDPELRHAAIAGGASEMLFKPVAQDLMLQAAAEFLILKAIGDQPHADWDEKVSSVSHELADLYAGEVRKSGKELQKLLRQDEPGDEALEIARRAASNARDYGFPFISGIARQVLDAQERSGWTPGCKAEGQKLAALMRRAYVMPQETGDEAVEADETSEAA
ncbi:MAG: response regulator [Planctomycetota bacterium]